MIIKNNFLISVILILISITFFCFYQSFINGNMNVIDEMQYLKGIIFGQKESFYPSPFFFKIMSLGLFTNDLIFYCRIINVFIFYLGFVPIYYFINKYIESKIDKIIAMIFYFFSPFSWYVNNIMPEILSGVSLYYLLMYFDLIKYKINFKNCILLSIFFVFSVSIKFHAVFLLIIVIFIVLRNNFKLSLRSSIHKVCLLIFFLISFLFFKLLLDYELNNTFTSIYGYKNEISYFTIDKILKLFVIKNILINLFGHLFFTIFFLIPFFYIYKNQDYKFCNFFSIIVLIAFILMICVSAFFIGVKGSYIYSESIFRVHSRYYSYLYPLLVLSLLSNLNKKFLKNNFIFYIIILLLFIFFSHNFFLKYYFYDYIDNPETNFFYNHTPIYFLCLGLVFFFNNFKNFIRLFLIIFILSSIIYGPVNYNNRKINTPHDTAGIEICKKKLNIDTIYTDNTVGFGFIFYKCPYKMYVYKNINDYNYEHLKNTAFVGNFVYDHKDLFQNLNGINKVNDSFFYY